MRVSWPIPWIAALALAAALAGCGKSQPPAPPPGAALQSPSAETPLPAGAEGDLVRRGRQIFDQTPKYAARYTGNRLSCSDCHIESGLAAYAAPMIQLANLFPMFNQRAGRVISLQERFQECFVRSENGAPPPMDSPEMQALSAYVNWLSRNGVKGKAYKGRGFMKIAKLTGDSARGKEIYQAQCAVCHGTDGAGVPPVLPPLWGPYSYNDGAGMNNPDKMAAFLIHNMPQNHPGSLTAQDAYDVAGFLHRMPRPRLNPAYKHY